MVVARSMSWSGLFGQELEMFGLSLSEIFPVGEQHRRYLRKLYLVRKTPHDHDC